MSTFRRTTPVLRLEHVVFWRNRDSQGRQYPPTLAKGEVVILDNLGSHKGKSARTAIRATGAQLLFLPPYSPDLNPVEQVFAKLKHLMRAAETRDVEATWRKVGELLDIFSKEKCANYLKNSYVSVLKHHALAFAKRWQCIALH